MSPTEINMPADMSPPLIENEQGVVRKMGIEIEFVGMTPEKVCILLKDLFGGEMKRVNDCEFHLQTENMGDFRVELDARILKRLAERSEKNIQNEAFFDLEGFLKRAVSTALEDIVPVEIVTPPLPIPACLELDKIVPALKKEGAKDTHASTLAAFGLHLNPETPSFNSPCILRYIQSYTLVSEWLRREISVDLSRSALPYINEYPAAYLQLILNNGYQPTMSALIDDYLEYNPSRNRALDMLPLLMHIDAERVQAKVDSDLVKPRPTFHYRLANSNINQPSWQFSTEWKRWLVVERLAYDHKLLSEMIDAYQGHETSNWFAWRSQNKKWVDISETFIKSLSGNI